MDSIDTVIDRLMWRGKRHRLAFPIHFAAGAHVNAGEQLDQRRLTGPVFAHDGMNFTSLKSQINGLQRIGGSESFVEFLEDQRGAPVATAPVLGSLPPCCV